MLTTMASIAIYRVLLPHIHDEFEDEQVLRNRLLQAEHDYHALHEELLYDRTQLGSVIVEVDMLYRGIQILVDQIKSLHQEPNWTPPAPLSSARINSRAALMRRIYTEYSTEEIKTLAFDIGIDPGDISGETSSSRARELVLLATRRGLLVELLRRVKEDRGDK
jgi:hypothetical protein